MELITLIIIAIGLSMDSLAVSIAVGTTDKKRKTITAIELPISIGIFHVLMIFIGWSLGKSLNVFISNYDHWLAFVLLSFVGIKMIYESTKLEKDAQKFIKLSYLSILILSLATSIDALAVGFSFSIFQVYILTTAIIIGIITFLLSLIGIIIGQKIGHFFENKIEILGGLILISIGVKILLEHLT